MHREDLGSKRKSVSPQKSALNSSKVVHFLSVSPWSLSFAFFFFYLFPRVLFCALSSSLSFTSLQLFFPQAYKKLVEREGTEGALPGLGLTEEQLFFVGFARVGITETSNPLKYFSSIFMINFEFDKMQVS